METKKKTLVFLFLILLPISTLADIEGTISFSSSSVGDKDRNMNIDTSPSLVIIPPTGGGGGGTGGVRPYYDVIVNVLDEPKRDIFSVLNIPILSKKTVFSPGSVVPIEIILINKGDIPDRDAVLDYYLLWDDQRYSETREQLFEVEVGETRLKRRINIPSDAGYGEWKIFVEYTTERQPKITVYDSFEVVEAMGFWSFVKERTINLNLNLLLLLLGMPLVVLNIKKREKTMFFLGIGLVMYALFNDLLVPYLTDVKRIKSQALGTMLNSFSSVFIMLLIIIIYFLYFMIKAIKTRFKAREIILVVFGGMAIVVLLFGKEIKLDRLFSVSLTFTNLLIFAGIGVVFYYVLKSVGVKQNA